VIVAVAGEEADATCGCMEQQIHALRFPTHVCVTRRREQEMVRHVPTLMDAKHSRRLNGQPVSEPGKLWVWRAEISGHGMPVFSALGQQTRASSDYRPRFTPA
jgi:hypothetical protein